MNDLVQWVQEVEQRCHDVYVQASRVFADDERMAGFFIHLAKDEKEHAQMMQIIQDYLSLAKIYFDSDIAIGPITKKEVEQPIKEMEQLIGTVPVSLKEVMDCVAKIEFSEWNHLFLYVIHSFKEELRELQHMTAGIQSHVDYIKNFINDLPDKLKPSLDMDHLPKIWEHKFLVVDDNFAMRRFISYVLSSKGAVDEAESVQEGIDKIKSNFYNIIVSNLTMPLIDGMKFYETTVGINQQFSHRFVFHAFDIDKDTKKIIDKNHLQFLMKPFEPARLMDAVDNILKENENPA